MKRAKTKGRAEKRHVFQRVPRALLFGTGLAALCLPARAEDAGARITGDMNWEKLTINASITVDVKSAGIPLPAGRPIAEALLFSRFSAKIEPFIRAIPVDSSSTLADWIERGYLSAASVDALANEAARLPPAYAGGFSAMTSAYTIDLAHVAQKLVRHTHAAPPPGTLTPVDSPRYTGILIIAAEKLPRHGHAGKAALVPCLFPRVWDTDMTLIYEKNMVEPETFTTRTMIHYTKADAIFQKTPSGIAGSLEKVIGDKPLRIIARGVFGVSATDPVISHDDALKIISTEANRQLLKEGRVAIVLEDPVLVKSITD